MGFNADGKMTTSRAVVAYRPGDGTDAIVKEYFLTAYSGSGVQVAASPVVKDTAVFHEESGETAPNPFGLNGRNFWRRCIA